MPVGDGFGDSDKKLRAFFADHPQPMWVVDREVRRFLDVNPAAEALYGYSREEFLSLSTDDIEMPVGPAVHDAAPARSHRTRDGRIIEIEVLARTTEYGGRTAELAVMVDLTPRRQLEDQLRQAQKIAAVGMLAGGVAHDFNNLLTIITGYSQLALARIGDEDPQRHSIEQIMKASERAAALTQQLLAFSRRQVPQQRVLDVNRLVDGLGTMLRRLIGEDIDLQLRLAPELGRVSADPGQLEQVVLNLAVNSRDAMPRGGVLSIETSEVVLDNPAVSTGVLRPGIYVRVVVADNGCGMDAATRARLFDPFFTTKGKGQGTGIGLCTVAGIVRQSGGGIEVRSEPGRGTSVSVYLPRVEAAETPDIQARARKPRRGSETVLVVEDDEMVRSLVRDAMRRNGYRVYEAASPAEARRVAGEYRGRIQLLITDVVMPGSSGRELADEIRALRPGIRVLYMSGYTDAAIANSGLQQHEVAFLRKPFTPSMLAQKVREVLETPTDRPRAAGA